MKVLDWLADKLAGPDPIEYKTMTVELTQVRLPHSNDPLYIETDDATSAMTRKGEFYHVQTYRKALLPKYDGYNTLSNFFVAFTSAGVIDLNADRVYYFKDIGQQEIYRT